MVSTLNNWTNGCIPTPVRIKIAKTFLWCPKGLSCRGKYWALFLEEEWHVFFVLQLRVYFPLTDKSLREMKTGSFIDKQWWQLHCGSSMRPPQIKQTLDRGFICVDIVITLVTGAVISSRNFWTPFWHHGREESSRAKVKCQFLVVTRFCTAGKFLVGPWILSFVPLWHTHGS